MDLSRRVFESSENLRLTGGYDPEPLLETTTLLASGGAGAAEEGAAGIFGGKLAKTADLQKLARAQQMAARGEHPDNIWGATGWFQGADGKWRFEISDKHLKTTFGAGKGIGQPQSPVSHPELAEAYPEQAKKLNMLVNPRSNKREGAFWRSQPETAVVSGSDPKISAMGRGSDEAREVTTHELQHFVQQIEGFQPGASPDDMLNIAMRSIQKDPDKWTQSMKDKVAAAAHEAYRRHAGEVEARNAAARLNMPSLDRAFTPPWRTEDISRKDQILRFIPVSHDPFK